MKYYEITSVDTGRTTIMSESKARKTFGVAEWKEIKAGYLPNLVVVETDKPRLPTVR